MIIHQFSVRLKDAGLFILYICTIVQNSFWFICTKHISIAVHGLLFQRHFHSAHGVEIKGLYLYDNQPVQCKA